MERAPDASELLLRDADPGVLAPHVDHIAARFPAEHDRAAFRELDRVAHEVRQDLRDSPDVALDGWELSWDLVADCDAAPHENVEAVAHGRSDLSDDDLLALDDERVALAGKAERARA